MGRWFVDDEGETIAEGSREFSDLLLTSRQGDDVRDFLVTSAGFAHIDWQRRLPLVRFCTETVHQNALIGVMRFLFQTDVRSVGFEHPASPGTVRLQHGRRTWLAYLQAAIDARAAYAGVTARDFPVAVSPFAERWRAAEEVCRLVDENAARESILERLFDGLFVLTRMDPDTGVHRFVSMGSGHQSIDPQFYESAAGRIVADGPDRPYAAWAMASYSEAHHRSAALADDIDARISWPHRPRTLFRYSRIRIPVTRPSGERLTLSACTAR